MLGPALARRSGVVLSEGAESNGRMPPPANAGVWRVPRPGAEASVAVLCVQWQGKIVSLETGFRPAILI
jgi:hypothetical protein